MGLYWRLSEVGRLLERSRGFEVVYYEYFE